MKIMFLGDNFIIYKLKNNIDSLSKEEIENNIKKILNFIKKKYLKDISGFYNVTLYINNKYGLILEVNKENEFDFFPDIIDIKLSLKEDIPMYLKLEDYFLIKDYEVYYYNNNFYVDINNISDLDIIKLSDYYSIIYGDSLNKIKGKFKLV